MKRLVLISIAAAACGRPPVPALGDGGGAPDADAGPDAGLADAGAADGGLVDGGRDAGPSLAPGSVGWIVDQSSYARFLDGGPAAPALGAAWFDHPATFYSSGSPPPFPRATWTRTFTAVDAGLLPALAGCGIPARVGAVLIDLESWSLTPATDKSDPVAAYATAWQAVQAYNASCRDGGAPLLVVAAPATDLVSVLDPDAGPGQKYQAFLSLGLASGIAPSCDVFEIQSQGSEMDASLFAQFVDGAAAQARAGKSGVALYAGISTNPSGQRADAGVIDGDLLSTFGTVSGYWLNIPAQGPACPNCGAAQPDVAVSLLEQMGLDGG